MLMSTGIVHADTTEIQLPPVRIFGSEPKDLLIPSAPKKISKEKLQSLQLQDVNKALKQTSGVYSREEDAEGLRPNIGLRGTSPDRSKKIVLMQDEVLIGPAPYSAPAAYYTPSMLHTSSLEIFKGFSALPYGPNSIGGAINYLTPEIPAEKTTKTTFSTGSFQSRKLVVSHGRQVGATGYLIELSRLQSDGFKKLSSGQNTGFFQNQALLKLSQDLTGNGKVFLTLGYGDENSKETYLGLSTDDFNRSPYDRYSASEQDQMRWKHTRANLKLIQPLDSNQVFEILVYRHDFRRAWYRLDRFGNSSIRLRDVVNDPTSNQAYFDVLNGAADSSSLAGQNGELIILNNDRTYFSQGVQSKYTLQSDFSDGLKNSLDLGLRIHQDQIRRDHSSDNYQMIDGRLSRAQDPRQRVDLNRETANAQTLFVLNTINSQLWALTFGARAENVQFKSENDLTQTQSSRSDQFVVPGVGATGKLNEFFSVRASLNQAATVAGLSADGSEKREQSTNSEIELKYLNQSRRIEADLTAFHNKYDNLTGTCSQSVGCTSQLDQQFNGGEAIITGIEGRAGVEYNTWGFQIPVQGNVTLLQARFANSFVSTSEEWGLGTVNVGDPLPYVPEIQYSLSVGLHREKWKQDLVFSYTGKSFDQAVSGGKSVAAYGVVDWTGSFQLDKNLQLTGKIDNLLANKYSVSYRPYGLRPGKPQSLQAGLIYVF